MIEALATDAVVVVTNRGSVYEGMIGTVVSTHESGTVMVLFPHYDIALPFGPSEITAVPEIELRAMDGNR